MATSDMALEPQGRTAARRRPFSTWVRRLTNFKSSDRERPKRHKTKRGTKLNNPYPQSGHVSNNHGNDNDDDNGESLPSLATARTDSVVVSEDAARSSADGHSRYSRPTVGSRSMAGTASVENEVQRSLIAPSHGTSSLAGTSRTAGGGVDSRRGGDSTFSSPAQSMRSLTTTLTTIQSIHPGGNNTVPHNAQSIQFTQPFPSTSPASAIPAHLAPTSHPTSHPTTYTAAIANNLLTDNASILTLASSSKRRRRRSMDTDASVRALAPSSLWGGSRESLPLSVLSANIDPSGNQTTSGLHTSGSRAGAERSSIYSTTGVAGVASTIPSKEGDGASVGSGLLSHGRPDSVSGSNGPATSPLASPRPVPDEKKATGDKGEERVPAPREESPPEKLQT